ncbi:argonaute family protein [Actinidia rufa]|uniref:Argonaute family protein n=1 Tax=Actinidia rufa TaxID=165716 RepID=A0A7J0DWQ1_9ERIC|nr:argonaute family protein [Actinidia rufa]
MMLSRFTGQNEEKLFNKVWVRNGAVLERKLNLVALENTGISFVQNFTTRGWINMTKFKAESVLILCQEFMANIKHESETEQGKEKLCSWVRGKKLKVTPDTFAEIFEIPREENPEFAFPNVGMPDLAAIGTGKTIDLPRIMFLSLCTTYKASDKRGSVLFTGFLTELFKRSGSHIPVDFIRIEPEGPLIELLCPDLRGKGRRGNWEEGAHEGSAIGMGELKEAILNMGKEMSKQMSEFREEVNTRLSSLEEESSRYTVILQDMKGMLIHMEEEDEEEEED